MTLEKATIIAGVLGDRKVIGIKDQYGTDHLAAKCKPDGDFFRSMTSGNFCISSRDVARQMSRAYTHALPASDYMLPFWGPKIIYTASIKFHRSFSDVTRKALAEAKDWNKGKHFQKDKPKAVFICGGAQIYKEALNRTDLVDEMYLTIIPESYKKNVEGDEICFPSFDENDWYLAAEITLNDNILVLRYRR